MLKVTKRLKRILLTQLVPDHVMDACVAMFYSVLALALAVLVHFGDDRRLTVASVAFHVYLYALAFSLLIAAVGLFFRRRWACFVAIAAFLSEGMLLLVYGLFWGLVLIAVAFAFLPSDD
ncbi:MAG: hypothetical protein IH851_02395 [Armatimonadetes bacterium]|nr:hypothetical protein [Armatimonadota bacterium]